MAATYEETLTNVTMLAAANLAVDTGYGSSNPGNQYRFVQLSAANTVDIFGDGSGEIPFGVLQNKPQVTGDACTVAISGISMVRAGGNITAGDLVEAASDGDAITNSAGTALGVAIEGGADGKLIPVLLQLPAAAAS